MRLQGGHLLDLMGVSGSCTAETLKVFQKNKVQLNWRRWEVEKTSFTYLCKTIKYGERTWTQKTIVPADAQKSILKQLSDGRGVHALPDHVKIELNLPDDYDPKDVVISVESEGNCGSAEFHSLYCTKCHSVNGFLSHFKEKYKQYLPPDPKLKDIWDKWDLIVSKNKKVMKYVDILGCVLPNDLNIRAGPNGKKYIARPYLHASSKCHTWTSESSPEAASLSDSSVVRSASTSTATSSSSSDLSPPPAKRQRTSSSDTSPPVSKNALPTFTSPTSTKKQRLDSWIGRNCNC